MKTKYIIAIIAAILIVTGIILAVLYTTGQFDKNNIKTPLKYGDYVRIRKFNSDYYWSASEANKSPLVYGKPVLYSSIFQILDSSGNISDQNIKNGDMVKFKVNDKILKYPLTSNTDCAPFWTGSGNLTEDLFKIQQDKNNIIKTNTRSSLSQNTDRKCGSLTDSGSPASAPVCKNPKVNNKFMFINSLEGYYVDNCNYRSNCESCEKDISEWIFEKV